MNEPHSPETILQEALDLADLQERAPYLVGACGDNEALRGQIESLIAGKKVKKKGSEKRGQVRKKGS